MKDLHDLFVTELGLMYDAEKQIVKALPNVINVVSSKKLKDALMKHLDETKEQVRRLENVAIELGQDLPNLTSEVMQSLLNEADKVIASDFDAWVKDAALINCAQHVEHFEIASYGILKSLAKSFGYEKIFRLLDENSKEEGHANKTLNEIAEGSFLSRGVNTEALKRRAA